MDTERQLSALRFETFAREVLEPAVHPVSVPLDVAVYQCSEPIPHELALEQDFDPVAAGWRWGPAWSTAWFRLRGTVPKEWSGRRVGLRFSCATEATFWRDGVPHHGLDANHDHVGLLDPARGDETLELLVEAACTGPLGATTFWWDERETAARWRETRPGRLERCELAVFEPKMWSLWRTYEFTRMLLTALPAESVRSAAALEALESATRVFDPRRPAETADASLAALMSTLRSDTSRSRTTCHAVGHAHIDTAWLWPLRETRRKCLRTFATALRLMDRFEDFRFAFSQAQQYAWVEQDAPELFDEIGRRVRQGRWEPVGAMWVEPDCNVPSGESLIRQLLHGTRYWTSRFGADAPQCVLYLPDTFGFPATLPQIMSLAGIDTFITNKLAWNQTNRFPHTTFRWRGLDGTEVVSHCMAGEDYNATNTPGELRRGQTNLIAKDAVAASPTWLQPFGYGDGGGGPTDWMIHYAHLAGDCEGLPEVRLSRVEEFRRQLHEDRRRLRASDRDLPLWDGELYLELHRGTYTSQAWLKRANRRAELDLRAAEWLSAAGPDVLATTADDVPARLEEPWRLVLLNQFHDILPGSSIGEVYDEARRQLDETSATVAAIIDETRRRWAECFDTRGVDRPALVFNETSWPQSGVVEIDGELHFASAAPSMGVTVVDRDAPAPTPGPALAAVASVRVDGATLSNGCISATIDAAGRIAALRGPDGDRNAALPHRPLNQLVLYDDLPRRWEAWDIDAEYEQRSSLVTAEPERLAVVVDGPLRAAIEVARPLGEQSRVVQRYELDAGSPCLVIRTRVEWGERRRLLRALFPIDVRSRHATCGVQFGHVSRTTHRNTSWERARFEWCVHGWADLSEPGFGVALLTDGIYGHSAHDGTLGVSLLRAPVFPDPDADRGEHELTYALMVHDGDWRSSGVDRQAALLQSPLRGFSLPGGHAGPLTAPWAPLDISVEGAAAVEISAVKREEDGERLIVRLVETHGARGEVCVRWSLPAGEVRAVDVLERPRDDPVVEHDGGAGVTRFAVRPFQIVTLSASTAGRR